MQSKALWFGLGAAAMWWWLSRKENAIKFCQQRGVTD
jgi:hypothetical protein